MNDLKKIYYELRLLKLILNKLKSTKYQVEYLYFQKQNSEEELIFIDSNKLIDILINGSCSNDLLLKMIYMTSLEVLSLHEELLKLPTKYIEEDLYYYLADFEYDLEPSKFSDFIYINDTHPDYLNTSSISSIILDYFDNDKCNGCRFNGTSFNDMVENGISNHICNCKYNLVTGYDFIPIFLELIIRDVVVISNWISNSFTQLSDITPKVVKRQENINNNSRSDPQKAKPSFYNSQCFKAGIVFASGEIDKLYTEEDLTPPQIAVKIGDKKLEKVILASLHGYETHENYRKNIFSTQHNKAQWIYNYCLENDIKVSDAFTQRAGIQLDKK